MKYFKERAEARPMGHSLTHYNDAQQGMYLVDYFAGQVLAGLLADPNITTSNAAECAWDAAIEMMERRDKLMKEEI